jgi:amidase
VSAGFAPFSIGTETQGSLIMPAGRAALFTLKPTIGIISTAGVVPITNLSDALGPMTKSAADLATLMDILVDPHKTTIPDGGYISKVTGSWQGLRIGTLDPEKWNWPPSRRKVLDKAGEEQLVRLPCFSKLHLTRNQKREVLEAYKHMEKFATKCLFNVPMIEEKELQLNGKSPLLQIFSIAVCPSF